MIALAAFIVWRVNENRPRPVGLPHARGAEAGANPARLPNAVANAGPRESAPTLQPVGRRNRLGMTFVMIPSGKFLMGDDREFAEPDTKPVHEVAIARPSRSVKRKSHRANIAP